MTRTAVLSASAVLAVAALAATLFATPVGAAISGDYLEARTSDVYTGPCVANGEVDLVGKEAILAWKVDRGGWDGVELANLAVVAVVSADVTLGDPHGTPERPARSVVLVDRRADAAQREALVAFAREMGGDVLGEVESIEVAPIEMSVEDAAGFARLEAGEVASLATRALNHGDHLCGNETVYYDPLAATATATPAVTLEHRYGGDDLGKTWSSPNKRSAFVGTFSR